MNMEEVRRLGAIGIRSLQTSFPRSDNFFFWISYLADPLYSFTFWTPLAAGFNSALGTDLLMVSIMAEWSNTLLKWLLMDHRPFWWIQETSIYGKGSRPVLRQTPLTCETGPGSPSGHVQGASSLMYVGLQYAIHTYVLSNNKLSYNKKCYISTSLWGLYTVFMFLIGASRLYTVTHFPHQVFLGLLAGLVTAYMLVDNGRCTLTNWWRSASRPKMLLLGSSMIGVSFGAYWLQRFLGVDPQWSVRLAFKWCEHPEWIHVNTTPLFSLVRDCGSMFGLALSAPNNTRVRNKPRHNAIIGLICSLFLMVVFHKLGELVPTSDVRLFYICHFVLNAVRPYVLFTILPRVARIVKEHKH